MHDVSLTHVIQAGVILTTGIIAQRRAWQPSPGFLPGESLRQRSLMGCSAWGQKKSDMTERLSTAQRRVAQRSAFDNASLTLLMNQKTHSHPLFIA